MTELIERRVVAPAGRPVPLRLTWLVVAVLALAAAALASVALGARVISMPDLVAAFTGSADGIAQAAVQERIPRTLMALVAGAGLGVSGAVMQGVTRNPLADPGILGVSTGAALAVVIGLAVFGISSASGFIWLAIAGAAVTSVFVYAIGSMGRGGATPLKLALAGAATAAALTSLINALLLPRQDVIQQFKFWQVGSVAAADYAQLGQVAPFVVVGAALSVLCARRLNALALGDDLAAGLGENVAVSRLVASLGAVLLCGSITAVAGPIGFVGLVVPHLCRLLVGVDHRWLLPFSAVVGALLLTTADVVGRVVTRPEEIYVGIITALVGAPVFIAIVRRQKGAVR